jgi:hypothetical protein
MYKREFIDLFFPPDAAIEIRLIDRTGDLGIDYQKQIDQPVSRLIETPDSPIVGPKTVPFERPK